VVAAATPSSGFNSPRFGNSPHPPILAYNGAGLADDTQRSAMPPSLVLGCLLGSIYGLLGHAFVGQRWRQLPTYWLGGIGSVPLLESSLGSGLALALLWLLIGRQPRRAQLAAGGDSADD
jgi:hypothetical protein